MSAVEPTIDGKHKRSDELPKQVSLGTRVGHLTWANFTLTMSTGGVALLLASTPHQFSGLTTIGKVIFVLDLVLFTLLCIGLLYRFSTRPGSLRLSWTHPTESLFIPTFLLSVVNLIACTSIYGTPSSGEWLAVVLRVLFWIYAALAFLLAVFQYWYLFLGPTKRLTVQSMTPAWLLPAFGAMLVGTLAGTISSTQPPEQRMAILIAGISFQGFGWSVSFIMYSAFLMRLIQYGLPAPQLRPGMFIAVGPPSFTSLALISISKNLPKDYGYFADNPSAANILEILALFLGIFLWTLAFWFFCIAAVSVLAGVPKMTFHLVWWAMVFPNVGFTVATSSIGKSLDSQAIQWVASGMTILIVCMWLFVLSAQIRAVWRQEIMMPGKDEDKDEYTLDDEKHGIYVPH